MTPITPPIASEPVSPMMIFAGWQLNQRKPRPAPTSAEQTTASSPVCGIKRDLKVIRDAKIPGRVGEQRIGESDRDRAPDGEAIQPVREIDGVGRADDDEGEKDDGQCAHIQDDGNLEERQVEQRACTSMSGLVRKTAVTMAARPI